MSVTSRQIAQLTEMGIPLWQRRSIEANTSSDASLKKLSATLNNIQLSALLSHKAFQDILSALAIAPVDISCQNHHLNMGLFNWGFSDNECFEFKNNRLITPTIESILQSPHSKKRLWQLLIEHNLLT